MEIVKSHDLGNDEEISSKFAIKVYRKINDRYSLQFGMFYHICEKNQAQSFGVKRNQRKYAQDNFADKPYGTRKNCRKLFLISHANPMF